MCTQESQVGEVVVEVEFVIVFAERAWSGYEEMRCCGGTSVESCGSCVESRASAVRLGIDLLLLNSECHGTGFEITACP